MDSEVMRTASMCITRQTHPAVPGGAPPPMRGTSHYGSATTKESFVISVSANVYGMAIPTGDARHGERVFRVTSCAGRELEKPVRRQ